MMRCECHILLIFGFIRLKAIDAYQTHSAPIHCLLLTRHGDSVWNGNCKEEKTVERFTGWSDVPLSKTGEQEALKLAEQLNSYVHDIDICFTSPLKRAQETTKLALEGLENQPKTIHVDYRLNERHYGALQGYVKNEVAEGLHTRDLPESDDPSTVVAWRRSWYACPPLLLTKDKRRRQELAFWKNHMQEDLIPRGESLQMVAKNRIRPFLDNVLTPILDNIAEQKLSRNPGETYQTTGLIVAHANSLRALLGCICEVEDDSEVLEVLERLRIPTAVPLVVYYQKLSNGKYRVCPLPDAHECIVQYDNGLQVHPNQPPPDLGHPKLPVWPLNQCIPLENYLLDPKVITET